MKLKDVPIKKLETHPHVISLRKQINAAKLYVQQLEGDKKRSWPEGRLDAQDDGEVGISISSDVKRALVELNYSRPTQWFAIPPELAISLANSLIKNANHVLDFQAHPEDFEPDEAETEA